MKPSIDTFQVPWELEQLLGLYADMDARSVLEIGVWAGGTLWHWIDGPLVEKVVAVDDQMLNPDLWKEWAAAADVELVLVPGKSQDREVVAHVAAHGPYDFVFVDGDHTHGGVWADWLNYSQMVAPGGAIAFHDILPRKGYGVDLVWEEVRNNAQRWVEVGQRRIHPGNEDWCGVGVAWL